MHSDGSMDLDTCAEVSEKLSALLDAEEGFKEPYTLEVCSPGAEREIRDLKELEGMTWTSPSMSDSIITSSPTMATVLSIRPLSYF